MIDPVLIGRLEKLLERRAEIEQSMSQPDVVGNRRMLQELGRELARLEPVASVHDRAKSLLDEIEHLEEEADGSDEEMAELAREMLRERREELEPLEEEIRCALVPPDPFDEKNILVEIRGGAGGEEAGLFAADLFRMYCRYAERHRFKVDLISKNETGIGGLKEVVFTVEGDGAYSLLKFEGGVHRVQRVPATEASGRIHTSTATVAVMPEAEEVDIKIDENEIRVDVFRSSGPGGQSVNTTDSAVRVTHLPTGLVVSCQDEKSQHKNLAKALKVMRARVQEREMARVHAEQSAMKRSMVGTGERSEKIRTYNFPQDRVTDHRINYTAHNLQAIMNGEIDDLIAILQREERLRLTEA